ncbi:putative 28S ribosomal protein S5, mitochondrial [Bombus vosnesenskii]|uniref:Small ribosomal subunit protein uS5m n=1 Tax=Bombus vosnesenskii TaxID=207650 RepID=A0A6J3K5I7_9HYME|nr:putative 28S ribosomal protein S5, mitochondrial [Bombus vosnesenskii]
MAKWVYHASKAITNCLKNINVARDATTIGLLTPRVLLLQHARNTNFYMRRSATQLWKSVTSVSNAGKRRGRGKGLARPRDLNRSQRVGCGKIPFVFPGLNAPVTHGEHINQQRRLTAQEAESLDTARTVTMLKPKQLKLHPLNRGWSGSQPGGKKLGPPDPVDDDVFHGFESWILSAKTSSIMTSTMGRSKRCNAIVVTGNGKGLAGFSQVTGREFKSTVNVAKNRAGRRLIYFERYNEHTILHDFFGQFGKTKVFVQQKQKGYGLKCHRVIKTCCEAIGIKDLYAKVEGSTNVAYIVKAFFIGLLQQKTYEEMANEKKLHVVEMRKENNYFPTVLASPSIVRTSKEIPQDEILDFKQYVMNGKVLLQKKKREPFFTKLPSWLFHLRKQERHRDQDQVIIRLKAEYGDVCSFLAEKYPEARASKWRKHDKKQEEESAVEA